MYLNNFFNRFFSNLIYNRALKNAQAKLKTQAQQQQQQEVYITFVNFTYY